MAHPPGRHAPGTRLGWLDVARGVLVLFVVIGHATYFMSRRGMDLSDVAPVVRLVQEVRIPALFFFSGILFLGASSRPWRVLLRNRVMLLGWLVVFWLGVEAVVRHGVLDIPGGPELSNAHRWLLGQLVLPEDYLWFVWGLLVMVLLGRALGRRPWALVLVFLLLTTTGPAWFPDLGKQTVPFVTRAPFFLLGLAVAPVLLRQRQRHLLLLALPAAVLFVVGAQLRVTDRTGPLGPDTAAMLVAVAGLPVVVGAAVLLSRAPGGGLLQSFGQRTLPVYIMHMPVLLVLMREMRRWTRPWSDENPVLTMVLLVTVTTAACLGAFWLTQRFRIRGVFDVPPPLTRLFDRLWRPGRASSPQRLESTGRATDTPGVRRPLAESASCSPADSQGQPPTA